MRRPLLLVLHTFCLAAAFVLRPALTARGAHTRVVTCEASTLRPGSMKEAKSILGKRPYGEESRRYRRTVYRHEDWLSHRSETRLLRNLQGTFSSGVVRSLLSEVLAVTFIALVVILWNCALFGYADLDNDMQPGFFGDAPPFLRASLPVSLFTLSSPALGLLLVFRTNTSYQRWLEARQSWGRIVSHCRNIMRQATMWIDLDDPTAASCLAELSVCVWAFPRSLWAHLSDPLKEPRFQCATERRRTRELTTYCATD
jgi:putative membrane protein